MRKKLIALLVVMLLATIIPATALADSIYTGLEFVYGGSSQRQCTLFADYTDRSELEIDDLQLLFGQTNIAFRPYKDSSALCTSLKKITTTGFYTLTYNTSTTVSWGNMVNMMSSIASSNTYQYCTFIGGIYM